MGLRHDAMPRTLTRIALLAMAGAATASALTAAPAHADSTRSSAPNSSVPSEVPSTSTPSQQETAVKPGVPQPVAEGSIGYIATPSATRWMRDRKPENIIANLPVGHRSDNQMMAEVLGGQLDAAAAERGACVQIIVGGPRDGGLFTYGFYALEPEYCPR